MNTHEIREMLKRNVKTRDHFLDVYGADQLPKTKIQRETWLLVCNCCPINLPGEHWFAIFGSAEQNLIDVFDSFGFPPNFYYGVHEFLCAQQPTEVRYTKVRYNSQRLQSFDSNACGQYCLFFAHYRSCGVSMDDIVNGLDGVKNRDEFIKCAVTNDLF